MNRLRHLDTCSEGNVSCNTPASPELLEQPSARVSAYNSLWRLAYYKSHCASRRYIKSSRTVCESHTWQCICYSAYVSHSNLGERREKWGEWKSMISRSRSPPPTVNKALPTRRQWVFTNLIADSGRYGSVRAPGGKEIYRFDIRGRCWKWSVPCTS